MPKNSRVHKGYEALLREGKSKESAARIAQSKTQQSLKTGKRPRGR
jgi:hypothetical protein